MSLLGKAALAMWWDMSPSRKAEFEHWHTHEHFPERLAIPGFRRATRWTSAHGGEGIFVMYELQDYDVLASAAYLTRLNSPTPWSTRMMPDHRNMIRSQCRVLESHGTGAARSALTLRLSPAPGRDESLRAGLRQLAERVPTQPGFAGLHVLRHETPSLAPTEEQRIRGLNDRTADWVMIAVAYDAEALSALSERELSDESMQGLGAAPGCERDVYSLACTAVPADIG